MGGAGLQDDQRSAHTKMGRFLPRTSLDELRNSSMCCGEICHVDRVRHLLMNVKNYDLGIRRACSGSEAGSHGLVAGAGRSRITILMTWCALISSMYVTGLVA